MRSLGRGAPLRSPGRGGALGCGSLGRGGAARALAAQLLEMMAEEWLLEGRRPEAAVVAALLLAAKASGLRGVPFEPEKQAVPRLLELLGLPASLGSAVKLRAREVKGVVLALARGLPG